VHAAVFPVVSQPLSLCRVCIHDVCASGSQECSCGAGGADLKPSTSGHQAGGAENAHAIYVMICRVRNHKANKANNVQSAVVVMSIAGPRAASLNDAIDATSNAGIVVVTAAGECCVGNVHQTLQPDSLCTQPAWCKSQQQWTGNACGTLCAALAASTLSRGRVLPAGNNKGGDSCTMSPCSAASAIAVGASTEDDGLASFSNIGRCLALFAPGSYITSTSYRGDSATSIMSGTSMSTPHVAGAAALYLQVRHLSCRVTCTVGVPAVHAKPHCHVCSGCPIQCLCVDCASIGCSLCVYLRSTAATGAAHALCLCLCGMHVL
jgi:hypothetical protein